MPAISKDGTEIAYSVMGTGPKVLLIDGAMCYREMGPMKAIAEALSDQFEVFFYDRRGRGESGDTRPFHPDREIEDVEAMIAQAGGSIRLFGISSGAILAAHAAKSAKGIEKLALYEAPFIVDDTHSPLPPDFLPEVKRRIDAGDVSGATKMFMKRVGMPGFAVWIMSKLPFWKNVISAAHTLPNDLTIVEPYEQGKPLDPADWKNVAMPTLVMDGGKSPQYMRNGQKHWAEVLPNAEYRTLPGQTHNVKTGAIAPVLREFFS
jgi:pimeloyl-ACP methyl ester carboxylesterase